MRLSSAGAEGSRPPFGRVERERQLAQLDEPARLEERQRVRAAVEHAPGPAPAPRSGAVRSTSPRQLTTGVQRNFSMELSIQVAAAIVELARPPDAAAEKPRLLLSESSLVGRAEPAELRRCPRHGDLGRRSMMPSPLASLKPVIGATRSRRRVALPGAAGRTRRRSGRRPRPAPPSVLCVVEPLTARSQAKSRAVDHPGVDGSSATEFRIWPRLKNWLSDAAGRAGDRAAGSARPWCSLL